MSSVEQMERGTINIVHYGSEILCGEKRGSAGSSLGEAGSSAPLKAFNQLGASPDQGNVTALYPTVVTAFP
jgi:hypothetical protein